MVIEYPIPNGTMKINVEEFFLHGTKARVMKVLDQYKMSGAGREAFSVLSRFLNDKWEDNRNERLRLLIEQEKVFDDVSRKKELYQKMQDPCYPEYTKDKKKLLAVRNEISSRKSNLNEVKRLIKENKKREERLDWCRGTVKAIIAAV